MPLAAPAPPGPRPRSGFRAAGAWGEAGRGPGAPRAERGSLAGSQCHGPGRRTGRAPAQVPPGGGGGGGGGGGAEQPLPRGGLGSRLGRDRDACRVGALSQHPSKDCPFPSEEVGGAQMERRVVKTLGKQHLVQSQVTDSGPAVRAASRLGPRRVPARPAAVPLRGGSSASQGGCSRRRIPATPTDGSISTRARPPGARIGPRCANGRAAQPMKGVETVSPAAPQTHLPPRRGTQASRPRAQPLFPAPPGL
ncbi:translation initiation factor IF-2-like [Dipodomys spectabilis]|uniref:translation initiation factor IF-2-like n=1 Tax=Dipodomys spectabilis TaxID=105255 RepID=UPI001C542C1C|nr:translation initiation factor IF-2-like [Dipodomys spectabilis]